MSLNRPIWKLRKWIDYNSLDWSQLSSNPNAIQLLSKNPDKINWYCLSSNPEAIQLLSANQDKIDYEYLSLNPNPKAIKLLSINQDNIDWSNLSSISNPEVIKLLSENQDKIDWYELSRNPSIFELDYEAMRIANQEIEEELLKEVIISETETFKSF